MDQSTQSLLECLKSSFLYARCLPLRQHDIFDLRCQSHELRANAPGLLVLLLCLVGLALSLLLLSALTLAHQLLHHQALVGRQQLLLLLHRHTQTFQQFNSPNKCSVTLTAADGDYPQLLYLKTGCKQSRN